MRYDLLDVYKRQRKDWPGVRSARPRPPRGIRLVSTAPKMDGAP